MEKINKLVHQMDKAIEINDYNAINYLYSQIAEIIPDDFDIYKGWFEYLITNYELYVEKLEKTFLNAIKKCKEAEQVCDKKHLGSLYLYEYKLIDILTSDYPLYFDKFNGDYLLGLIDKVILLQPDNIEAYEIRSSILLTIGQEEAANADIEMQEKLSGETMNVYLQLNLAMKTEFTGNIPKSIEIYKRVLNDTSERSVKQICCSALIRVYKSLENMDKVKYYEDLLSDIEE